jgi:hypothetical protein
VRRKRTKETFGDDVMSPAHVLDLQRTVGNRVVTELLTARGARETRQAPPSAPAELQERRGEGGDSAPPCDVTTEGPELAPAATSHRPDDSAEQMGTRTEVPGDGGILPLLARAAQAIVLVAPLVAAVVVSGALAKIAFVTLSAAMGAVILFRSREKASASTAAEWAGNPRPDGVSAPDC